MFGEYVIEKELMDVFSVVCCVWGLSVGNFYVVLVFVDVVVGCMWGWYEWWIELKNIGGV